MKTQARVKGLYTIDHLRNGKLIGHRECSNGIVNSALNDILEVYFKSGTPKPSWFIGLIDSVGFTQLAETDTISAHSGWVEYTTYNEATRPEWNPGSPSLQQVTNAVARLFNVTVDATLKGFLLASDATKGGAIGTLWSTALFDEGDLAVKDGDTIRVTYTILASDEGAEVVTTGFTSLLGDGMWWGGTPRVTFDSGATAYDLFTPSAGNPLAFMFRVRRTGTISKIGHRVGNVVTGTYDVRIEGIDDTDGTNDGVLISAGAIATAHAVTSPGDDNTWQTAELDTPTPVVQGQKIAVVFAFNAGAHQFATLNATLRQAGFPYVMTVSAAVSSRPPIIALEYDDGIYNELPGCFPWSAITSPQWNDSDSPDERALKIKSARTVKILGFWIDYKPLVAGADVEFVLYDSDGITILETVTHDGDVELTPGTTMGTRIFMFAQEHTLAAGLTYRLSVKPVTANDVRVGLRDVDTVLVAAAAPGGAEFGISTRTDAGAWTDSDLQRINSGLYVTEVST